MDRVGVVIPLYNHERYVGEAVRSVLGQSIDGVELVVVDDGSKDGSVDAARAAMDEFPGRRSRLIAQENRGAHAAIMRGVDALDTPVLAVLNSDDAYEPERFERVLPRMQTGGVSIAFTGLRLIDDAGRTLPDDHAWSRWYAAALTAADTEPTIGFALLVHNFSVTSGNFVFTRSLYDRLGGFGDQKFAHDWDFLIRATALTEPVFVEERLMRYRVHGANTTESVRGLLEAECERAMARYAALLEENRGANPIAPCAEHWASYWTRFGRRRPFFAGSGAAERNDWYQALAGSAG
jgi:glycosyltransferase involved in cell wall biosynthesis